MEFNKSEKYDVFECFAQPALVTAGDISDYNTMTIGWGALGTIWGKSACTVYVRLSRYTLEFIDKNEYFTVSFFDGCKKDLGYLGSHSGRDGDKVAQTALTPMEVPHGVSFKEAKKTLVVRKLYRQEMDLSAIPADDVGRYYSGADEGNVHVMFIGEVEGTV